MLLYILNVCNAYIEFLNVIFFCVYRFLNVIFFMCVYRLQTIYNVFYFLYSYLFSLFLTIYLFMYAMVYLKCLQRVYRVFKCYIFHMCI